MSNFSGFIQFSDLTPPPPSILRRVHIDNTIISKIEEKFVTTENNFKPFDTYVEKIDNKYIIWIMKQKYVKMMKIWKKYREIKKKHKLYHKIVKNRRKSR